MEFFCFDGGFSGKVVLANLRVLMEVVMLVQLMVRGWTWEIVVGVTEGIL